MQAMGKDPSILTDVASIHLKYENGSLGVINYFSNGHKSYPKERIELYYEGKNLVIDNFRRLEGYGFGSIRTKQDKGHRKQFQLLADFWQNGGAPIIPFEDLYNTTLATFAALESLQKGHPVKL
jgi:predicted dehydrogenase